MLCDFIYVDGFRINFAFFVDIWMKVNLIYLNFPTSAFGLQLWMVNRYHTLCNTAVVTCKDLEKIQDASLIFWQNKELGN